MWIHRFLRTLASLPIYLYRWVISPWLPPSCRYTPDCSRYALQAINKHGGIKGLWLTLRRIGRCRPGACGGHDPVPDHFQWFSRAQRSDTTPKA